MSEQDKRTKVLQKENIKLIIEITGECKDCGVDLAISDLAFSEQLKCPECGSGYSGKYQILRTT